MKYFRRYFRTDGQRLIRNYAWFVSVIGVMFSLFFSLETSGFYNESTIGTYVFATNMTGFILTFVFCAFPYAAVFAEELEHKYIRYGMIRGNLKSYVISKIVVIYISSVVTMVWGTLLFVLLCHTQIAWISPEPLAAEMELQMYASGCYGSLAENGHYLAYCMMHALHWGLLAGMLSVMAAFFSVYISNRVLVLILPAVFYRMLLILNIKKHNIRIFDPIHGSVFGCDWKNLLLVLGLSVVPSALLTIGIYKSLKKKM